MKPRVSFIVASYNYGRFVAQTLDSLLGQTFEHLEIIVVDDASSDNSREVLERYRGNPKVRLVFHETNRGNIASYNEGLAMAGGEFIGLLASDDFCLRSDAVARQVAMFDQNVEVGMVHTAYCFVDPRGVSTGIFQHKPVDYVRDGLEEFVDLLQFNYVLHSGTLVRRSCHAQIGYYDPRLAYAGDWDLWLRVSAHSQVGYIAEPLYAYRTHGTNMNATRISSRQEFDELLLTLERAFAELPPDASRRFQGVRRTATRRALLLPAKRARLWGRKLRAWQYLLEAAQRSPGLILSPELYTAVGRTLLLTSLGAARYDRLTLLRASLRSAGPRAALGGQRA